MKENCGVIRDLIPLYLDGVCCGESGKLVEEHLECCEDCRQYLDRMKEALPQPEPPAGEEKVLKRTAGRLGSRAVGTAAGVTAIVLYWLIYLWQDSLSNAGDYRYFSYGFHELYSVGMLLVPLATLVWLAVLLVRTAKGRRWKKNALLLAVLALLLAGQFGYQYRQSQLVHVTSWTEVLEVPDPYHIVVQSGEGTVTLETTPTVTALVRTDGTVYGFSYERDRRTPERGDLTGIWGIVE